jgi:hypothetical protein
MDDNKRRTIFKIAEGKAENLPLIHGLESFKKSSIIFEYCVRRGITGQSFYNLFQNNQFSPIRVGAYLLKKIESDKFRSIQWSDIRR